jgi:target of EGR1 protein 1
MLVHKDNFDEVMLEIQKFSSRASFASIDCEFTGCGTNKYLYDRDLEQKYEAIRALVNGHSIISLGLTYWFQVCSVIVSLILLNSQEPSNSRADSNSSHHTNVASNETRYRIRSFTFLLAIADEFVSTPSALKFLVEHGFDFNLLFTAGISYQRARGVCDVIEFFFFEL